MLNLCLNVCGAYRLHRSATWGKGRKGLGYEQCMVKRLWALLTRVMLFENPRKLIVAESNAPASHYGYAGFAIGWLVDGRGLAVCRTRSRGGGVLWWLRSQ